MKQNDVILKCRDIVLDAGFEDSELSTTNFLDYSNFVRDIVKEWSLERKNSTPWLQEFAIGLRKLRDDFESHVQRDPMMIYKPAHKVALEFHQSQALIRYFRGGNRISKTQSGVADNYWVLTGQHPYRPQSPLPCSVGIIGVNFTKYATKVFNPKYVEGEGGNPLSPVFPEGGKWFNWWDSRKHILKLACPDCAEANKAGSCKHAKSTLVLFSDNEGPRVLQGGQYAQIQFDEEISQEFFGETLKRLDTVPNSGLIVTETPLHGKGFWTNKILTRDALAKKSVGSTKQRLVTLHTISQFDAGLTNHDRIKASMEMMSPAEVEARVYGRPAAFSETGVFDAWELSNMQDQVFTPQRGMLWLPEEQEHVIGKRARDLLYHVEPGTAKIDFKEDPVGLLRIWKAPEEGVQYIIGADVAQGLTKGDPSCACVLAMEHVGYDFRFEQVAQYHGWINPRNYAEDLVKLAIYYNEAMLVPERKGPGDEAIRSIREWGYWNLFRDTSDPTQAEFQLDPAFGLDTNVRTKSMMIAMAQQAIKDQKTRKRSIEIFCNETLDELGCYGQELSPSGQSIRFRGTSGMHDDRVMAMVIAIYAAKAFPVYDYDKEMQHRKNRMVAHLTQNERETWAAFDKQVAQQGEI